MLFKLSLHWNIRIDISLFIRTLVLIRWRNNKNYLRIILTFTLSNSFNKQAFLETSGSAFMLLAAKEAMQCKFCHSFCSETTKQHKQSIIFRFVKSVPDKRWLHLALQWKVCSIYVILYVKRTLILSSKRIPQKIFSFFVQY